MVLKKFIVWIKAVVIAVWFSPAYGADLIPFVDDGHLHVRVKNIEYPAKVIDKKLASGLPNKINIAIEIAHDGEVITTRMAEFTVTYDLWAEMYRIGGVTGALKLLPTQSKPGDIVNTISTLTIEQLAAAASFNPGVEYTLRCRVIFNPVNQERITRIRQWASKRGYDIETTASDSAGSRPQRASAPPALPNNAAPGPSPGPSVSLDTSARSRPRFRKLFDKILEQFLSQDGVAAYWTSPLVRTRFTLDGAHLETK